MSPLLRRDPCTSATGVHPPLPISAIGPPPLPPCLSSRPQSTTLACNKDGTLPRLPTRPSWHPWQNTNQSLNRTKCHPHGLSPTCKTTWHPNTTSLVKCQRHPSILNLDPTLLPLQPFRPPLHYPLQRLRPTMPRVSSRPRTPPRPPTATGPARPSRRRPWHQSTSSPRTDWSVWVSLNRSKTHLLVIHWLLQLQSVPWQTRIISRTRGVVCSHRSIIIDIINERNCIVVGRLLYVCIMSSHH